MTTGHMTNVDRALLASEWSATEQDQWIESACPTCRAHKHDGVHRTGCAHDAALAERGYPDQESRDRSRALLVRTSAPTLPPPPESP